MLCIKEGDNNIKFFHKVTNSSRRYNYLSFFFFFKVDGVISEEGVEMTTQVIQFYKTLFQETKNRRPFVEGLEFDQIGGMERVWM